jgi:hypothetical protein
VKYLNLAFVLARLALIGTLMPFAIGWRTPLFAGWRLTALFVLTVLPLIVIAFEIWLLRRTSRHGPRALRALSFATLLCGLAAFGTTATLEVQFRYKRHTVLNADQGALERLGRHVFIGYRDPATLAARPRACS